MIKDGIKTEEYREIKPYWIKRLGKPYSKVCFHRGYNTRDTMSFQITDIKQGVGRSEWGAINDKLYIISFTKY